MSGYPTATKKQKVLLALDLEFVQGEGLVLTYPDQMFAGKIYIPVEGNLTAEDTGTLLNKLGQMSNRDLEESGVIDNSRIDPVGSILDSILSIKKSIADISETIKK
jgi:hypothetical protein